MRPWKFTVRVAGRELQRTEFEVLAVPPTFFQAEVTARKLLFVRCNERSRRGLKVEDVLLAARRGHQSCDCLVKAFGSDCALDYERKGAMCQFAIAASSSFWRSCSSTLSPWPKIKVAISSPSRLRSSFPATNRASKVPLPTVRAPFGLTHQATERESSPVAAPSCRATIRPTFPSLR